MARYFLKELISNPLWLKCTGAKMVWEPIGDDHGIFATDSQPIIDELDTAIKHAVGGVVMIDKETYESLKKKRVESPSPMNSLRDRFSLSGLTLPSLASAVAANPTPLHGQLPDVPKEQPSEPLKIQTEFTRPKTARGVFRDKTDAGK